MLTPLDAREQAFDEEKQWRSSDTRCLRRARSSVAFSILMILLDVIATAGNARLGLNRPVVLSIGFEGMLSVSGHGEYWFEVTGSVGCDDRVVFGIVVDDRLVS